MKTKNYLLKQIVNFIFNERIYHKIKLYKIITDFILGRPYEISPVLSSLIKETDVVLDIGANMGQFACRLNNVVNNSGHVYSFEPVKFNFIALLEMKKLLKLEKLSVYKYAISDKDGFDYIRIPIYSNGLVVGTQSTLLKLEFENNFRLEEVVVRSIDSIVNELKILKIDFIKSDTEGNEINVLQGAYNTIKSFFPTMYLEINFKNEKLKYYYELGYFAYHYKNKRIERINETQVGDLILIHVSKIQGKWDS